MNFDQFSAIVLPFLMDEDDDVMHEELKEAFRLYDKEGWVSYHLFIFPYDMPILEQFNINRLGIK